MGRGCVLLTFLKGAGVFRYDYAVKQNRSALQAQLEVSTNTLDLLAFAGCCFPRRAGGIAMALDSAAHQRLHVG